MRHLIVIYLKMVRIFHYQKHFDGIWLYREKKGKNRIFCGFLFSFLFCFVLFRLPVNINGWINWSAHLTTYANIIFDVFIWNWSLFLCKRKNKKWKNKRKKKKNTRREKYIPERSSQHYGLVNVYNWVPLHYIITLLKWSLVICTP